MLKFFSQANTKQPQNPIVPDLQEAAPVAREASSIRVLETDDRLGNLSSADFGDYRNLLFLACALGLVPDSEAAVLQGRKALSEQLAAAEERWCQLQEEIEGAA